MMTTTRLRKVGTPVLALISLLYALQIWYSQHEQAHTQQALTAQRGSLASDVDTLRQQVRFCRAHPHAAYCRQPAAPDPSVRISQHPAKPVIVVGADGKTGADGERGPGPTQQQMMDAINKYMALHPLSDGKDGAPGKDGTDGVTPPCMALPTQCVGPKGDPGADGKDGAPGKDGKDGAPGRDGVSIVDTHVDQSTCDLIVTYSDGRQQNAGRLNCPSSSPNSSTGAQ